MTQVKFNADFKKYCTNWKVKTLTDRRLTYNDLMESYFANKMITEKQRNNWGHPAFLEMYKSHINCLAYQS